MLQTKKQSFFLILLCLYGLSVHAQTSVPVPDSAAVHRKHHAVIGLNVTSTLASFLGTNTSANFGNNPYLLTLRLGPEKSHCRMGLNFKISTKKTPDNLLFNTVTNTKETSLNYRVGWGSTHRMSKRISFYWGIDWIIEADVISVSNIQNDTPELNSTLHDNTWGFGAGPVLGFQWRLFPRVFLSAESTVYAIYKSTKQKIDAAPDLGNQNSTEFSWQPTLPTSVFLQFAF